ncbi:MAG TPA: DUF5317 family protein [Actinomycetota bacterium]|jgi:hypothetical protein|nr:DUF5317 family protein [Actinomycetota bacterium]
MFLVPGLIVLAVLLGYLLGGRLSRFENLRINRWGLAILGAVLTAIANLFPALSIGPIPDTVVGPILLALSYFLLAVFLISNRWIPAGYVMIAGLLLNLVVVVANGGMPVRAEAITTSGGDPAVLQDATVGKHHLMSDDDVLWHLGDVIGVPEPIGVVLSPGDVLLYGGMVYSIVQIMRGRRRENPRPLALWFPGYRGKHAPEYWRMPVRYRHPDHAEAETSGTEP